MPKAAPAKTEEKQVSEAAFLKALDRKKATAAAAAKAERPTFLDDSAILERLGLKPGDSKTFNGAVEKVVFSFAKNDANRPMFRFVYVLVDDDSKINGIKLSNNHILEEAVRTDGTVWRTEQQAQENLFFELQGLGEDTAKYRNPLADAVAAAKQHTKDKTPVSITVSHYISKDRSKTGMNVKVNGPIANDDNSDLDSSKEDESAADDGFNADDWIGGWVKFDSEEYGEVSMQVEAWDEDTDTFSGTDSNGEKWEGEYAPKVDDVAWDDEKNS